MNRLLLLLLLPLLACGHDHPLTEHQHDYTHDYTHDHEYGLRITTTLSCSPEGCPSLTS